jgi:hypothetical protein
MVHVGADEGLEAVGTVNEAVPESLHGKKHVRAG